MSGAVRLVLRAGMGERVDLGGVTPDRCASLTERQIAGLPVTAAGQPATVGDLFDVHGGEVGRLEVEGDLSFADHVGAGMIGGEMVVRGHVGDGAGMAMSGGVLRVFGNAGHRLGGGLPGASKGMTGGEIVVDGNAGDDAGARMRRGLVVVAGSSGASAGRAMIAGTLAVFGTVGDHPAEGNKRGSLIAIRDIPVPSSYRFACTYEPPFVRLLMTYLERRYGLPLPAHARDGLYRRYCGDAAGPGKGEILALVQPA